MILFIDISIGLFGLNTRLALWNGQGILLVKTRTTTCRTEREPYLLVSLY